MKKKCLKPQIQSVLEKIVIFEFILLACIDDFNFKGFMFMLFIVVLIIFNIRLLTKYGKDSDIVRVID